MWDIRVLGPVSVVPHKTVEVINSCRYEFRVVIGRVDFPNVIEPSISQNLQKETPFLRFCSPTWMCFGCETGAAHGFRASEPSKWVFSLTPFESLPLLRMPKSTPKRRVAPSLRKSFGPWPLGLQFRVGWGSKFKRERERERPQKVYFSMQGNPLWLPIPNFRSPQPPVFF